MNKIKSVLKIILPESVILFFRYYPKAILAAFVYGFPARKMTVIGVAGTKGKTTTCHLIASILEEAGKKTAMISTASLKIGEKEELNSIKMTTPPPFFLQSFIKKAVQAGCKYLVLETSSHALIQRRVLGIPIQVAVLTNLMPDHLEYHKTAQNYQTSHQKIISRHLKYLIINVDDQNLKEFVEKPLLNGKKIIYGFNQPATVIVQNLVLSSSGSSFKAKTPDGSISINFALLGKFNVYNALAALSVAFSQQISLGVAKLALEKFNGAPGRLERVEVGQDFGVIVDYAHSPDSLNNLFRAVDSLKQGKIIVVFGACGERDPNPRPQMGEILDQNADYIIVTNDDPYREDPEKIAQDLILGIKNKTIEKNLWKILDRKSAIEKAISLAQKKDLVLILGKGAEQWQVFKDKKISWDDRKMAKEIIQLKLG